jgi:hypothetical protein
VLGSSEVSQAQGELQPEPGPAVVEIDAGQPRDLVQPVVQGGSVQVQRVGGPGDGAGVIEEGQQRLPQAPAGIPLDQPLDRLVDG